MREIIYPGYHAHFISSDGKSGGGMCSTDV